ncbi:MAG TPA: LCP family protein [Trebonia sp.]|nr:LCP family protein [Trebonia sp.]
MFKWHGGAMLAGKAGYGIGCVAAALILVVSGYAYFVKAQVGAIGGSNVLNGGPQTGAMNILLMGLESRTDYNGNILPSDLLTAMHAGSVQGVKNGVGGQDTNTLILIHIFAGGKKAVGFSIPRDDWVTFPKAYDGQSVGKVDQAYGLAYAQSLGSTVSQKGLSSNQRYLEANEAGQAATIATVSKVTGQKIDHFAEVNMAGFFELAQSFGGIEVCLKSWNGGQNLHDTNSGFNQKSAGYHFLAADQALAFVRERDNLPNGDIDRTRRQQAVIDYVIWKLGHEGIFSDLGQLTSLLDVAKRYVITDQDWQILDFATEMRALTGSSLQFETLPIVRYQTFYLGGQAEDANAINVPAIQAEVKKAFTAPSAMSGGARPKPKSTDKPTATTPSYPASGTTVDVANANGVGGLAGEVMSTLVSKGYAQGQTGNAPATQSATQVLYGSGASAKSNAAKIAGYFGVTAQPSGTVSAGSVEVVLGSDTSTLPSALSPSSPSSPSSPNSTSTPGAASSSSRGSGSGNDTNTPLKVKSSAPYGIPCVY